VAQVGLNISPIQSRTTKPRPIFQESYFPAYSRDGSMTDEALQAAIADATTCAKKMKKVIPLRQIADRASRPGRR